MNARYDFSDATYILEQPPGSSAFYFGKHSVNAEFVPSGTFSPSTGKDTFVVSKPEYTTLSGGVKVATILPGIGPGIQSGQTANVLYTGYLEKNGHIFDDSVNDGGALRASPSALGR